MEYKLLIVDDEPVIPKTLADIFKRQGYKVVPAFSGQEALDAIKSTSFDLILLDIEMPGISGLDVLKQVKDRNPHTKVVIVTGHKEYEKQSRILKCDEFLKKPFSLDALTHHISHLLKKKHSEEKWATVMAHKYTSAPEGAPMANIMLIEPLDAVAEVLMHFLCNEKKAKGYYKVHHVKNGAQAVAFQKAIGPSLVMIDLKTVISPEQIVQDLKETSTPPKDFVFYFEPTIPTEKPLSGRHWQGSLGKESNLEELSQLLGATALEHGLIKK